MTNKTKTVDWEPHNPCKGCYDEAPCETCGARKYYIQSMEIIRNVLTYLIETSEGETIPVAKLESMLKEIRRDWYGN